MKPLEERITKEKLLTLIEELQAEELEIFTTKNHDYGADDPLRNLKATERIKVEPWVGVVVRMLDKMSRLEGFVIQRELKVINETVHDTLLDLSVYAKLCRILLRIQEEGELALLEDLEQTTLIKGIDKLNDELDKGS